MQAVDSPYPSCFWWPSVSFVASWWSRVDQGEGGGYVSFSSCESLTFSPRLAPNHLNARPPAAWPEQSNPNHHRSSSNKTYSALSKKPLPASYEHKKTENGPLPLKLRQPVPAAKPSCHDGITTLVLWRRSCKEQPVERSYRQAAAAARDAKEARNPHREADA